MDNVYVVRWGPALGDDYSVQVFTEKADMLQFLVELQEAQQKILKIRSESNRESMLHDNEVLNYEVHYIKVNDKPSDILNDDIGDQCSSLICFGEYPNMQIWRNGTEEHQT